MKQVKHTVVGILLSGFLVLATVSCNNNPSGLNASSQEEYEFLDGIDSKQKKVSTFRRISKVFRSKKKKPSSRFKLTKKVIAEFSEADESIKELYERKRKILRSVRAAKTDGFNNPNLSIEYMKERYKFFFRFNRIYGAQQEFIGLNALAKEVNRIDLELYQKLCAKFHEYFDEEVRYLENIGTEQDETGSILNSVRSGSMDSRDSSRTIIRLPGQEGDSNTPPEISDYGDPARHQW